MCGLGLSVLGGGKLGFPFESLFSDFECGRPIEQISYAWLQSNHDIQRLVEIRIPSLTPCVPISLAPPDVISGLWLSGDGTFPTVL